MTDNEFITLANNTLASIAFAIEKADKEHVLEVDFMGENVVIETPVGQYIINRHTPAKEIWIVSPISGPAHFAFSKTMWKSATDVELFKLLARELSSYITLEQ